MVLIRLQRFVLLGGVVEDLQFDAVDVQVSFRHFRTANAEAVVGSGRQLELELEHEVGVLGLGQQVPLASRHADQVPVFDRISGERSRPPGQRFPIEQRNKTVFHRERLLFGMNHDAHKQHSNGEESTD